MVVSDSVKTELDKLPIELIDSLKALSNEKRLAIMVKLLTDKKGYRSFSELMREFDLSQGALNNHLSQLMETPLLKNIFGKQEGNNFYSIYTPTTFAKIFFDKLLEVAELPFKEISTRSRDIISATDVIRFEYYDHNVEPDFSADIGSISSFSPRVKQPVNASQY